MTWYRLIVEVELSEEEIEEQSGDIELAATESLGPSVMVIELVGEVPAD